ncbi:reverse transcriptase domain-containing protein, partial [Tanacetum coccineum]
NTQVQTRGWEAAIGMTWEDFKVLMRKEFFPNNEMQKVETEFWCHAIAEAGHAAYTDRFHELARLVPHFITLRTIGLRAGMLTDEAIRNGSLRKNTKKKGNGGEPSRDGNFRDDHKRSRTRRAFVLTTNLVRREYTGVAPKLHLTIVVHDFFFHLSAPKLWPANTSFVNYSCRGRHARISIPRSLRQLWCSSLCCPIVNLIHS